MLADHFQSAEGLNKNKKVYYTVEGNFSCLSSGWDIVFFHAFSLELKY